MMSKQWILPKKSDAYEEIPASEEHLLAGGEFEGRRTCTKHESQNSRRRLMLISALNGMLFCASMLLFALAYLKVAKMSTQEAIRMTSEYSVILNSLDVDMRTVKFNGSLWPPDELSFSRMEPGDQRAEPVWASFEPADKFAITRDDVLRMGKDPEKAAKVPDEHFGLGDDMYFAGFDVTHKLHCLNELREMTFANYPRSEGSMPVDNNAAHAAQYEKASHSKLWWYHLRHCVDMIAQDLMCHADADLYTYEWRDTQTYPYPDFSVNRKCRDFDQLLAWRDQNQLDVGKWVEQMKFPGKDKVRVVPHDREYYETNGFDGSVLFPDGEGFEEYFGKRA